MVLYAGVSLVIIALLSPVVVLIFCRKRFCKPKGEATGNAHTHRQATRHLYGLLNTQKAVPTNPLLVCTLVLLHSVQNSLGVHVISPPRN